MATIEKIKH